MTLPTIGDKVWANNMTVYGIPYLARVEKISWDNLRVRVRPLHPTLTVGSARSQHTRKGPSIRARWVGISSIAPANGETLKP